MKPLWLIAGIITGGIKACADRGLLQVGSLALCVNLQKGSTEEMPENVHFAFRRPLKV
jgi:hypothetical protein